MNKINPYRLFVGSMCPNWLMRQSISAGAKLAYARLAQYAGENGFANPRISTLAAELGMPVRTVNRAIKELKGAKLIISERRGLMKSNVYFFLDHPWISSDMPKSTHPDMPKSTHQDGPDLAHQDVPQAAYIRESEVRESKEEKPKAKKENEAAEFIHGFWNPNYRTLRGKEYFCMWNADSKAFLSLRKSFSLEEIKTAAMTLLKTKDQWLRANTSIRTLAYQWNRITIPQPGGITEGKQLSREEMKRVS